MPVLYASGPTAPPDAPASEWNSTQILWEGSDGSKWDLSDPTSGVYLSREGLEGLHFGDFTEWTQQSPGIRGQLFNGTMPEAREVVLPIEVYSELSSAEWLRFNDSWWSSLSPRSYGTLTIILPGGRTYTIRLRLRPKAGHPFNSDPVEDGWAAFLVTMIADDPLFRGQTDRRIFKAQAPTDPFFERTGPHLVNIAPGSTTATATVDNVGVEDAWLVWMVFGEMTSARVGVGADKIGPDVNATLQILGDTVTVSNHGLLTRQRIQFKAVSGTTGLTVGTIYYVVNPAQNTFQVSATPGGTVVDLAGADGTGTFFTIADHIVDIPFSVPAGKVLVIDTDPTDQRAMQYDYTPPNGSIPEKLTNPVERTVELTGRDNFAPVSPGMGRQLTLDMVGTGEIHALLTPLYWRVL